MAKVLISVEDALLRRIDRAAKALGLSRSGYLARLATDELRGERAPGARRASREAMRHIDRLVAKNGGDGEDSTTVIRDMRDSR
jgi:metal-responsive CopG/Arc/MetJ family transcriptional regulator